MKIPDGWKKVKFGDVVHKVNDKVLNREEWTFERYIGGQHFDEGEIRVTNSSPIKGNEEVIGSAFHMKFKPGQVLYVTRNPRLRKGGMVDFEGVCSNVSFVMQADETQLLQSLLPFIIQTEDFVIHTCNNAHGSTNPFLNWKDIAKFELMLPPLDEQKKINEILWSIEDNIKTLQILNKKTDKLFYKVMNESLTPLINLTKLMKLDIKNIPTGWNKLNLIELSKDGINNGVFNDPKKIGSGYRLINVKNLYSGNCIDVHELTLLELSLKEFLRNKAEKGDLFFTRSSLVVEGIAHSNINLSSKEDITFDGHVMRVRPNEKQINPLYLLFYCKTKFSRLYLQAHGKTTTMTTISQKDLGSLPVIFPKLKAQNRTLNNFLSFKQTIQNQTGYLEYLKNLRNKFSNEFLSGNITLS